MKNRVEQYKNYLINQAKSNNTISSYVSDLNHFFTLHDEISRDSIIKYKEEISGLSSSSINRKLSSLKSFNEFLFMLGLVDSVKVIKRDFIKVQSKGNPTDVTELQVSEFLDKVNNKYNLHRIRNIAIVFLIATTGIMREEITNLKLRNLDLVNGELKLIGQGDKERTVLLNDIAIKVIKDYLKIREKHKFASSQYIFLTERGNKLNKDTINYIFNYYCAPECKITPKQLRNYYGTTELEQNANTQSSGKRHAENLKLIFQKDIDQQVEEKKQDFVIDDSKLDVSRKESDEIRDRLIAHQNLGDVQSIEKASQEDYAVNSVAIKTTEVSLNATQNEISSNVWNILVYSLDRFQKEALNAILLKKNVDETLLSIARQKLIMKEILIESINEIALENIGDNLIDTSSTVPYVYDDYIENILTAMNEGGLDNG